MRKKHAVLHYVLCSLGTLLVIVLFSIPHLVGSCSEWHPCFIFIPSELPKPVLVSDVRVDSIPSTLEESKTRIISPTIEQHIDFQREDWY